MLHIINKKIRRVAGRIGLRFIRTRRGSVLILVVVLLVLMALLGTAFLVTTRTDLAGSKLYEHNVQIDLLVQGVLNMSEAAISDSTYQTVPVPGTSTRLLQYYDDWFTDSSANGMPGSTIDHTWMASRFPVAIYDPTGANTGSAIGTLPSTASIPLYPIPKGAVVQVGTGSPGTVYLSLVDNNESSITTAGSWASFNVSSLGAQLIPAGTVNTTAVWPAVSAPLAVSGNYPAYFEDPRSPAIPSGIKPPRPDGVRTLVAPCSIAINGVNYPALTYYSTVNSQVETALAASATGNGIADSFLWRLPIGSIDGITYYAAVRIVDNNSAINVNTANSSTYEWACDGTPDATGSTSATAGAAGFSPGILPSGIGLAEMTYTYNTRSLSLATVSATSDSGQNFIELNELNRCRWSSPGPLTAAVIHPAGIQGSVTSQSPIDDMNQAHSDFVYRNVGDAIWNGLGRRISNPGAVQAGTGSTPILYTPFSWSESVELAYRGDLINPNATPSIIEQVLAPSVYNHSATPGAVALGGTIPTIGTSFRTQPWDPINTPQWACGYQVPTSIPFYAWNRRAFFVARNPTNNCMPAHALTPAVTGLIAGDTDWASIQNQMAGTYFPSTTNPTPTIPRVSLNTADVTMQDSISSGLPPKAPTLWLGFYNAMLDVFEQTVLPSGAKPYLPASMGGAAPAQGYAQFRSPLRDTVGTGTASTTYLSGPQTVLLRSLLAACNAKDLRDSDDDVTEETISNFSATVSGVTPTPVNLYAFGYEKQPFITEVYANNETTSPPKVGAAQVTNTFTTVGASNPKGYVLVELYNPYDVPINMTNWTFGVLTRTTAYPKMTIAPLTSFSGFASGTVIPSKSYMILENYPGGAGAASASSFDATYRPWKNYYKANITLPAAAAAPGSVVFYYVPNLHQALQDTTDATHPGGELMLLRPPQSNGGAPIPLSNANINNFVPVDSFDFSGMTIVAAPPANTQFTAMHYLRASPGQIVLAAGGTTTVPSEQLGTYWKFVYPGRWSSVVGVYSVPQNAWNTLPATSPYQPFRARQEGIAVSSWDSNGTAPTLKGDPWADSNMLGNGGSLTNNNATNTIAYNAPISFGTDTNGAPFGVFGSFTKNPVGSTPAPNPVPFYSSYPNAYPAIQLNGTDMGGPNKQYAATPQTPFMFPFGGFARIGDVLQVPYIGSYTIANQDGTILEMNPITRDCALADDGDNIGATNGPDDTIEQIGRFCPLLAAQQATEAFVAPGTAAAPGYDSYAWASHIFDYFTTIQNPNDDYFPNTDPNTYYRGAWNLSSLQYGALTPAPSPPWTAPGTTGPTANAYPRPVLDSGTGTANAGFEDVAPIDGLININTASAATLAAVPFLPTGGTTGTALTTNKQFNQAMAANIISYRNTYGPFKTLFDLNRVLTTNTAPNFQNFNASTGAFVDPSKIDYTPAMGDISPLATSTDGVTNDFETRFGMITRVSNLLTTRSDTYTVYVLVQGWSGVGTLTPQVVVQRRAAIIVDRSKLTSTNRTLGVTQVPAY